MHEAIKAWLDNPVSLAGATVLGTIFLIFCGLIVVEVRRIGARKKHAEGRSDNVTGLREQVHNGSIRRLIDPDRPDAPVTHLFKPTRDGLVKADTGPGGGESEWAKRDREWKEIRARREVALEKRTYKRGDVVIVKGQPHLNLTVGGAEAGGGDYGDPIYITYWVNWFDTALVHRSQQFREELLEPIHNKKPATIYAADSEIAEGVVLEMEKRLRAAGINDTILIRRYGDEEGGERVGWCAYVSWLKSDGGEPLYRWEASCGTLIEAICAVTHRVRDGLDAEERHANEVVNAAKINIASEGL